LLSEKYRGGRMDYLALALLSLGLSVDDFGVAFSLSLLMPAKNFKQFIANTGKMAVAFSISTALFPTLGWLIGLAIYKWLASFGPWIVLIVFTTVGIWIIKEALEGEEPHYEKISSFWAITAMGSLGSIDEGAVGISFPFLGIPIPWIILAIITANTVLVFTASTLSIWIKKMSQRTPSIVAGIILITLGVLKFLELAFGL
jgi:putative Mn2+ efflux pump MntP